MFLFHSGLTFTDETKLACWSTGKTRAPFFLILFVSLFFVSVTDKALCEEEIRINNKEVELLVRDALADFEKTQYDDALEKFSQAGDSATNKNDKTTIANIVAQGGFHLRNVSRHEEARSYFLFSLKINKELNNKSGLINNYSFLGDIASKQGGVVDAIELFEKVLPIQESINDQSGKISTLNNLANLYSILGEYSRSTKLLERALTLSRKKGVQTLTATTLISWGALHYNLRNYEQAVEYLNEALEMAKAIGDKALQASTYTVLGAVYRQQSDFETALNHYERSFKLNKKLKLDAATATSSRVLGELYLHRIAGKKFKNQKAAEKYLRQALKLHQSQQDLFSVAMTKTHLGEYYYQRKEYDQALIQFNDARDQFKQLEYPDGIGRTSINIGFIYKDMGKQVSAIAEFDNAISIYQELHDREWTRVALFGKALSLEKSGNLAAAEKNYKRSIDMFESIRAGAAGGDEAQDLFTKANSTVYANLVTLLVKRGDIEGALDYVERSRLREIRDYILNTRHDTSTTRDDKGLDMIAKLSISNQALMKMSRRSKDPKTRDYIVTTLARNEQEASKVVAKLDIQYAGLATTLDVTSQTHEARKSPTFPDDLAIVTYFVTEKTLFIFVAKKGEQAVVKSLPISKQKIREQIIEATKLISNKPAKDDTVNATLSVLKDLYNDLIAPIEQDLKNIKTVAILPFDYLSFLPFEALVLEDSEKNPTYFIQHKNIAYLSNKTYANQFYRLSKLQPSPEIDSIVAFGNPDLGNKKDALPYAQLEVSKIKDFFPDSKIFVTKNASKKNFFDHWGKYQVVHIAAHAKLTSKGSEILFAPKLSGTLTMSEIFDLPKNKHTKFVALSGCQTGVDPLVSGKITLAEWQDRPEAVSPGVPLASTVHNFSRIHVPAILATLWKINDQATAILMTEFYRNLKQGQDIYPAFKTAQLCMIGVGDSPVCGQYSHPYYWSAFVYYGLGRW